MPATDETFRRQPTLHVVFAISSIVMLLTTVWMVMADHLRPWKDVQRRFHRIETDKLKAAERQRANELVAKHKAELERVDSEIAAARQLEEQNSRAIRVQEARRDKLKAKFDQVDTKRRFKKAELDSQRSFYDGMIDRDEVGRARAYIAQVIAPSELELVQLTEQFEAAKRDLDKEETALANLRGNIADREKEKKSLERALENAKRALQQKEEQYYGLTAWFRGLPIIDLAAPPTKIQQISLPELTINYNFKDVPRYDRCTTCHLAIDRPGYETSDAEGKPLPAVYRTHPHLADGATAVDPKGNVVAAGLYLDGNGPHKINSFGCTICHGGQGSGTDFTFASHTPNGVEQAAEWAHTNHWHEIHFWDEPMLPKKFLESSCLKCHHQVTDVPQAKTLQAGYERITRYGCTGCHTIGGEGAFGPDLTDNRQVGPNLAHLGSKVSKEWAVKWIRNPHAFRPDTRMPRFYDVSNNMARDDQAKVDAEVHAIAHYLFAVSTPPEGFVDPPQGNPENGKTLFFQKGCMACHQHRPYERSDIPSAWRDRFQAGVDPAQTFDPKTLPEGARPYADAEFGPNLVNIAAKFPSKEQGFKWLANWIQAPERYHAKSLMPNLQLTAQEAADIAAWVVSVPGIWPVEVDVPPADSKAVDEGVKELVKLYLGKSKTYKGRTVLLAEVDSTVEAMEPADRLMYLGERTIGRLGCFGCHNIPGFADAKPIGTPLNGWGAKNPSRLDFGHVTEYIKEAAEDPDDPQRSRDGTPLDYQHKVIEQSRMGFLYQKLHRPRSYDYQKTKEDLKSWDDRLRMPQFTWADDQRAIEEVMTFVLGLTGEKIPAKYLPQYKPATLALARGERLLNRYNCAGCHTLEMPRYTIEPGTRTTEALPDLATNVQVSYGNRANDYLEFYPGLKYDASLTEFKLAEDVKPGEADPKTTLVLPRGEPTAPIVFEGMPINLSKEEDESGKTVVRLTVQLWKPATVRGYQFNVGDNVTIDPGKVESTPPAGGRFAFLYSTAESERTGTQIGTYWNRLPPPLLREGLKVQTPWLTSFLKDPYAIRPAANLRMPRFHYGATTEAIFVAAGAKPPTETELDARRRKVQADIQTETRDLANFFAARDGAEFPYQDIPERERGYLAEREQAHADYLGGGWAIMTKGLCIQCHAIGQFKPTGGADVVNGPDLRQVAGRFRPAYLLEWIAQPSRLLPFTAMPQNLSPHPAAGATATNVPKSFDGKPFDQVRAVRDTLLNYVTAVEQQLAVVKPADTPPPKPPGAD
jgi:cbb3-type cytochrome oxidase cytochrome c subunit